MTSESSQFLLALLVLLITILVCGGLWYIVFKPTGPSTFTCSINGLQSCTVDEYNAICDPEIPLGQSSECEAHCDRVAAENLDSISKYRYCLRSKQYKHLSACHLLQNFTSGACLKEYEAYCAGNTGEAICKERCANASAIVKTAVVPDEWDFGIFCDHPFCPNVPSSDQHLCSPCFRSLDIGSELCKAEPLSDRQRWCAYYRPTEVCRDYCVNEGLNDPVCQ